MSKKNILFYSGHGEIIGGDAKYLVDLANHLPLDRFDVMIATDENKEFRNRITPQLHKDIKVFYVDTRPTVFKSILIEKLFIYIQAKSEEKKWAKNLRQLLTFPLNGRELVRYFRYVEVMILRSLTFAIWREWIHNKKVFKRFFSELDKPVTIFHANNGGYPANEACLAALSSSLEKEIPIRIMTVHSSALARRFYRKVWDWRLDRVSRYSTTHIVTASEAGKSSLTEKRGFDPKAIKTIYCGLIDKKPMAANEVLIFRKKMGFEKMNLILLMVGNLGWRGKGWDILFKAAPLLRREFPQIKILLAGGGAKEDFQRIEKMIESSEAGKCFRLLGFRNDIHELNSIADILVAPFTSVEATPYVIKEAMRAARPVIASDIGGCREAVFHGVNGFLVPPGHMVEFKKACADLLADDRKRREMGLRGREIFEERFALERCINEHLKIYEGKDEIG